LENLVDVTKDKLVYQIYGTTVFRITINNDSDNLFYAFIKPMHSCNILQKTFSYQLKEDCIKEAKECCENLIRNVIEKGD
jgi:hypothetical protein